MKILVTGGAGFIGSNLCEALLKRGDTVVCLDNFSTGKYENIASFFVDYPTTFKLNDGDICNLHDCKTAVKGVDYVFHEAALDSVPLSIKNPILSNDTNICGFLNMLVAARDANIKRFIYAASSSTYGDNQALPNVEDTIGKPLSHYAVTKLVNELYADVFAKTYSMECIGLRYFNVFGCRQDPDSAYAAVIPLFIKKFIAHEPITINGDGNFSRDFTHIDNVIKMNILALTTNNPSAINQVFNTAYSDRTSLNQLVGYLKEFLCDYDAEIKNVEVIHGPNRLGDIPHSQASIEKANDLIGYRPVCSVKEGLVKTVKWYWEKTYKKEKVLNML